jgi:hypothetical protein
VRPTGESPAATRAAVGAFIEGTIAEGATRTERDPALDWPGAWALLGRAGDDTWIEPKAKERACTLDGVVAERGAARGAKRWGAGLDEWTVARRETTCAKA